ncbi:Arginine deiminase [Carpediemonas membranifera]|uniref:Arginine deiminase n=1 Tax=Carpediemonas membranifera TaxID=201153 RepID=A0A142D9X1_9EUKA|nr:arginine deiminase [Carpediemonas membranifera]KAG9395399.1 Arginine deiminase [Carpediemonas membranifera]|eukprot:KAG9395399.1 Arginine deiminase [Carpediemonas membranifera]
MTQLQENDIAKIVITHSPGIPVMLGSLHPEGNLFEKPINLQESRAQHAEFRRVLREHGCKVYTVREILEMDFDTDLVARAALQDLAMKRLQYELEPESMATMSADDMFYISDSYKRSVIESMCVEQVIDTIMLCPRITLKKADRNTALIMTKVQCRPLGNMVFTRDQQVTTPKGIVMGNLNSPQRRDEVDVMEFAFKKLGLNVLGRLHDPLHLEGGDFIPAIPGLCMVGVGLRSNVEAVLHMARQGWLGPAQGEANTCRVAIVKDLFDRGQDRMHLDCTSNVTSDRTMVMCESIIGDVDRRRLVDEWIIERTEDGKHNVSLARHDVELSAYVKQLGFEIIPLTDEQQLAYGVNILNLGNNKLISVHEPSGLAITRSPTFVEDGGSIHPIQFRAITSLYGSVHCASQVVHREPLTVDSRRAPYAPPPLCPRPTHLVAVPSDVASFLHTVGELPGGMSVSQAQQAIRDEYRALYDRLTVQGFAPLTVTLDEVTVGPLFGANQMIISAGRSLLTFCDGTRDLFREKVEATLARFYDHVIDMSTMGVTAGQDIRYDKFSNSLQVAEHYVERVEKAVAGTGLKVEATSAAPTPRRIPDPAMPVSCATLNICATDMFASLD